MKKLNIIYVILLIASVLAKCSGTEAPVQETTEPSVTEVAVPTTIETTSETTAENIPTDTEPEETAETIYYSYENSYIETIDNWLDTCDCDTSNIAYNLIFFDEDDVPELVIGQSGYWSSMYTCKAGQIYELMDEWSYGIGGNHGYLYIPHSNKLYNLNSECAGAYYYEYVFSLDESMELIPTFTGMRNYVLEGDDMINPEHGYLDVPIYYIDDEEVSEEVYTETMNFPGDVENYYIEGMYSYDEIMLFLTNEYIPDIEKFQITMMDVTWEEANGYCTSQGGYLATISSEFELIQIERTIDSNYSYDNGIYFVGGIYCPATSDFRWVTDGSNSEIDSGLWKAGEPSYIGITEDGRTLDENYTCFLYVDDNYCMMDVPNDILDAAPSYAGRVALICEFD